MIQSFIQIRKTFLAPLNHLFRIINTSNQGDDFLEITPSNRFFPHFLRDRPQRLSKNLLQ